MHPSTQKRNLWKSVTYIKWVIIQRKECKSQSPSLSGPSGCVNSPVLPMQLLNVNHASTTENISTVAL